MTGKKVLILGGGFGGLAAAQQLRRVPSPQRKALGGDFVMVARGADKHPEGVPGFAESAINLYDAAGAVQLREALKKFDGGRIVIICCTTPFSCPGAPYEAAFLVDSILRSSQKRDKAEIAIYTPEPRPLPSTGTVMGEAILGMFKERHIAL